MRDPEHRGDEEHEHGLDRLDLLRIALVAIAVGLSWSGVWRHFVRFDVVALVATLVGGYPIFREALSSLWQRRMTMELSMTIALASAVAIGEYFTAVVIVLFVLIAEVLEHMTVGRGRKAIKDLLDFLPRSVIVRRAGATQDVAASTLGAGDIVVVRPGARVPVDGVVTAGHSFVDQAAITGESMPVEKTPGARVFAGTVNQSGVLDVQATGIGRDTAFARIIEAVEHAEQSRAPIQKTADRLAGYLVYFAIGAALLTYALTRDMRSTISVVIVAGACGIAAGTPLAILGAVGRAARQGAIVKGGLYVELLGNVDTIVLDKTGTLTLGTPAVVGVRPVAGVSASRLLESAAIAERPSEHPLGKAILERAARDALEPREPDHFGYTPGKGIVCSSNGETIVVGSRALLEEQGVELDLVAHDASASVLVARAGMYLGSIEIVDIVRPEASKAMAALRSMGLRTLLVTGDSADVAQKVAAQLGVDEVRAEMLPHQKLEVVKALQASGCKVAMVGDGINDAPALAQAEVGIAMGSGTDVARESADVVLLGNDLLKLVEAFRVARSCRRIIRQNFVGTLAVDGAGVLLAAFGFLNPLVAALIHVTSELVFILNSARLLPGASPSPLRPSARMAVASSGVVLVSMLLTTPALAHHEALFGPQSSLAVESEGFVSLQTHAHAYGINGTQTQETTFILSGGISPVAGVPWSITLVQPFTYQTTRQPTAPGSTGPFTACDGCFARENNLLATSYRFDFTSLQRVFGKDGNFALLSAALEPPTGDKDYPVFQGPFNLIGAGMFGLEWRSVSAVALGYYRRNTPDATASKKGDNFLLGLGFAYTPIDTESAMLSFQVGVGDEYHLPDVDHGSNVGGGNEVLVSPTIVGSPLPHLRIFALVSLPVAQSYSADYQVDRWRAGVGAIYSFEREPPAALPPARIQP